MKPFLLSVATLLLSLLPTPATATASDSSFVKKGFSFGILPAISFDSDLGFQYGVLSNLYWYGDGSRYPAYDHSLYVEWSRHVAGTMLCRLYYDSPMALQRLSPTLRLTTDFTLLRDLLMDFFGFNGHQSVFNSHFVNNDNPLYRSSAFYAHHRRMIRLMAGVRHDFPSSRFYSQFGITAFNFLCGPVRRNKLQHHVPDTPSLYDLYLQWGVIPHDEATGGTNTFFRLGIGYDCRDNEAFPTHGFTSELLLAAEPPLLTSHPKGFLRLTVNHQHYFSLGTPNLVLALRLTAQNRLAGHVPFYLLPHITTNYLRSSSSQGLGGSKTLRGIMRNRIVADGIAMANIELRWLFSRFQLLNQQWALGINAFSDMGITTQSYHVDTSHVPDDQRPLFFRHSPHDVLHTSLGAGLKVHMNANFIVSADYGHALRSDDGSAGFYIKMNYLF